jgi:hypothetical protein
MGRGRQDLEDGRGSLHYSLNWTPIYLHLPPFNLHFPLFSQVARILFEQLDISLVIQIAAQLMQDFLEMKRASELLATQESLYNTPFSTISTPVNAV